MEYQYYNDFYDQKINTGDLWRAVKQCEGNFQHSDLVAFREKLQLLLFDYKKITAEFHAITWRYHRDKYKHFSDSKWFDEIYNYVFEPDFFMEKSNNTSLNGLTDEHKLMIVVPEKISYDALSKSWNIELTENEKKDILEKLNKGERYVNTEDDNDPYNWWRWSYDIYTLNQEFEIDIEKNPDEFEYFFAWQLAVTDLYKIKEFLTWHLENTFQNRVDDFKEYIKIMYKKYKQILKNKDSKTVVFKNLKKFPVEPTSKQNITEPTNIEEQESGRKIDIYLPKIKQRIANDGITSLSLNQTAYLFNMLRNEKIIFKDESYQTKENIYKAIQVLTGYSKQTIKKAMNSRDIDDSDKVVTQKIIQKLII